MSRRYRRDHTNRRRVVAVVDGVEGFWSWVTTSCSGCFEAGEYMGLASNYPYDGKAGCHIGSGCDECGHTGKRRRYFWQPFDQLADPIRAGETTSHPPSEAPRDHIQELCDLVKEAGGTVRLHGRPVDAQQLREGVTKSLSERLVESVISEHTARHQITFCLNGNVDAVARCVRRMLDVAGFTEVEFVLNRS